jgi:tetratricopeptide (TPR) repeat protein
MSQLLSDAKQRYDEGVRLLERGERSRGLAKFGEARKKTQEVKLMFPLNQEAGMLELRMDQVADPPAFDANFRQLLTAAVAGTRPAVRSAESFAMLQNLAEINPRYPGIRQAVIQAEIDMGIRLPPPDPRALAQSDSLARQARVIVDGDVRPQFEVALTLLDQALALNPNNAEAMRLKDQVQTQLGKGGIVMDSESERLFQAAVQELQNRNTLNAYSIVQQLLQKPENRNSTRILELQRRIESML